MFPCFVFRRGEWEEVVKLVGVFIQLLVLIGIIVFSSLVRDTYAFFMACWGILTDIEVIIVRTYGCGFRGFFISIGYGDSEVVSTVSTSD